MGAKKKKRRFLGRYRRRGVRDKRLPILPTLGASYAALFSSPYGLQYQLPNLQSGKFDDFAKGLIKNYTPYNPFTGGIDLMNWINMFVIPTGGGYVASKVASAVGVNRAIRRVPLIGKYIKL